MENDCLKLGSGSIERTIIPPFFFSPLPVLLLLLLLPNKPKYITRGRGSLGSWIDEDRRYMRMSLE